MMQVPEAPTCCKNKSREHIVDVGELRDILLGEGAIRTHKCLFMGDPGKLKVQPY